MTAQVAILNKSAVALAADSAATVVVDGVIKVHQSNKLFALREGEPIGIMVYGNAEFMGVPWATLINMYRNSSKVQKTTTTGYALDFLRFIKDLKICRPDAEVTNALQMTNSALDLVREDVDEITLRLGHRLTGRERNDLFESVIERRLQMVNKAPRFKTAALDGLDEVFKKTLPHANAMIDQMLEGYSIYKRNRSKFSDVLRRILCGSIARNVMSRGCSGVVIAGFGDREIFPTLVEVHVDGFVAGTLRLKRGSYHNIGRDGTHAVVVPFAQREMVSRFMEGIDPAVLEYLMSLKDLVYGFSKAALNAKFELNSVQDRALEDAVKKDVSEYLENLRTFLHDEFWGPIVRVVAHLPQEDLATMAESLVSLTSLKRHVSSEQETVGGPVDVAVVSKGSGFTWVKSKFFVGGTH